MKKPSQLTKKPAFSLIELSIVILIIGILVIGITKGGAIIRKAKLSSAQSITASSPVGFTADLVAWFEPTLGSSFIDGQAVDGQTITGWKDNSASTNNNATSNDAAMLFPTLNFAALSINDFGSDMSGSLDVLRSDLTSLEDSLALANSKMNQVSAELAKSSPNSQIAQGLLDEAINILTGSITLHNDTSSSFTNFDSYIETIPLADASAAKQEADTIFTNSEATLNTAQQALDVAQAVLDGLGSSLSTLQSAQNQSQTDLSDANNAADIALINILNLSPEGNFAEARDLEGEIYDLNGKVEDYQENIGRGESLLVSAQAALQTAQTAHIDAQDAANSQQQAYDDVDVNALNQAASQAAQNLQNAQSTLAASESDMGTIDALRVARMNLSPQLAALYPATTVARYNRDLALAAKDDAIAFAAEKAQEFNAAHQVREDAQAAYDEAKDAYDDCSDLPFSFLRTLCRNTKRAARDVTQLALSVAEAQRTAAYNAYYAASHNDVIGPLVDSYDNAQDAYDNALANESDLQSQADDLSNQINDIEDAHDVATAAFTNAQSVLNSANADVASAENAQTVLADATAAVATANADIDTAQSDIDSATRFIDESQTSLNTTTTTLATYNAVLAAFNAAEQAQIDAQTNYDTATSNLEAAQNADSNVAAAQSARDGAASSLSTAQTSRDNAQASYDSLSAAANTDISDENSRKSTANSTLSAAQTSTSSLQNAIDALSSGSDPENPDTGNPQNPGNPGEEAPEEGEEEEENSEFFEPKYSQDSINGLPAVSFAGNAVTKSIDFDSSAMHQKPYTVFIVEKRSKTGSNPVLAIGDAIFGYGSSTVVGNEAIGMASVPTLNSNSLVPRISTFISDNDSRRVYVNGVVGNAIGTAETSTIDVSEIGGEIGDLYRGDVSEIIIFNRGLKISERNQIQEYLGTKYGIDVAESVN